MPEVLEQLPDFVVEQLPVILTHRGAIDKDVADLMVEEVLSPGGDFSSVERRLRELRNQDFVRTQQLYYQFYDWITSPVDGQPRINAHKEPKSFGKLEDMDEYWGCVPTSQWLSGIFTSVLDEALSWCRRYQTTIFGRILRSDHTHEVCKYIRNSDHQKVYSAVLTIMNEWGQIVAQWFVETKSYAEVNDAFAALKDRYAAAGQKVMPHHSQVI